MGALILRPARPSLSAAATGCRRAGARRRSSRRLRVRHHDGRRFLSRCRNRGSTSRRGHGSGHCGRRACGRNVHRRRVDRLIRLVVIRASGQRVGLLLYRKVPSVGRVERRVLLGVVGLPRGNPRRSTRQLEVATADHLLHLASVGERDDDRHHVTGDARLNVDDRGVSVDAGVGRVRVRLTDCQGYPLGRDGSLVLRPQHLALVGQALTALDLAPFDQLRPVVGVLVEARTVRPEGEGLCVRGGQLQFDVDDGVHLLLVGEARVGDDGANLTFVTRVDLGGCGTVDEDLLEAGVSAHFDVAGRCSLGVHFGPLAALSRLLLQVCDLQGCGRQRGLGVLLLEGDGLGQSFFGLRDLVLGGLDARLACLRTGVRVGLLVFVVGVAGASRQHGDEDGGRGNRGGHPGVLRTHLDSSSLSRPILSFAYMRVREGDPAGLAVLKLRARTYYWRRVPAGRKMVVVTSRNRAPMTIPYQPRPNVPSVPPHTVNSMRVSTKPTPIRAIPTQLSHVFSMSTPTPMRTASAANSVKAMPPTANMAAISASPIPTCWLAKKTNTMSPIVDRMPMMLRAVVPPTLNVRVVATAGAAVVADMIISLSGGLWLHLQRLFPLTGGSSATAYQLLGVVGRRTTPV